MRVYLEKISTSNLARQQIHFPRYDAARYRELYNNKVQNYRKLFMAIAQILCLNCTFIQFKSQTKQEASIRMMRREPPQWVCSDLSSFSEPDNLKENKVNRNRKGRNSFDPKVKYMPWRNNNKLHSYNSKPFIFLFRLPIVKCPYSLEISYGIHSNLKDSLIFESGHLCTQEELGIADRYR